MGREGTLQTTINIILYLQQIVIYHYLIITSKINCDIMIIIFEILRSFLIRYLTFCHAVNDSLYTQRNLVEILLNQPKIRLYLSFSDWFGPKPTSVWFQSNRCMVNTIWFQFNLIRFQKDSSVCTQREVIFWILSH